LLNDAEILEKVPRRMVVQQVMIGGSYAVRSVLKINPGETTFQCALSGFQDTEAEEAAIE
jgi:hypothetical protein